LIVTTRQREQDRRLALSKSLAPSVKSLTLKGGLRCKPSLTVPLDQLPPALLFLDTSFIHFPPSTLLAYVRLPFARIRRLRNFGGKRVGAMDSEATLMYSLTGRVTSLVTLHLVLDLKSGRHRSD
jgi:hypothetical protein